MAKVSSHLNFPGNAEKAFNFYNAVFHTEFDAPIVRMGDMPSAPDMPKLSDDEKNKVMHVSLPILGGTGIMATDTLESMGHKVEIEDNTSINLEPDSREDIGRIFADLSEEGSSIIAPQDMPWGAYWGTCLNRCGIRWIFNYASGQ